MTRCELRATIRRTVDGAWLLERSEEVIPLQSIHSFELGGCFWTLERCPVEPSARERGARAWMEVRRLQLCFLVSRDEEHVQLRACCGDRSFDLGACFRHYLLLMLARHRLADARAGFAETSCGWIHREDVARDALIDGQRLNLEVYRIRNQFAKMGVIDAPNIIERRPRTGQLRIGTTDLSILPQ
jgi:hypothetical protein